MLIATAVFFAAVLLATAIEQQLRPLLRNDPVNAWLGSHLYFPTLRMLGLLVFVLAAYPELFGHGDLPPLGILLEANDGWFGRSLNLLFVIALFAPLLPFIGVIPGIMLPLQGIALTALMFGWISGFLDMPFSFWPGAGAAAAMLFAAILGPAAALLVHRGFRHHAEASLEELLLLAAQLPVIVIYGHALGRQIPGT